MVNGMFQMGPGAAVWWMLWLGLVSAGRDLEPFPSVPSLFSSFQVSFKVYSSNPCAAWVGPSLSDASWDGDVREPRSAGLSTSFDDRWRKVKGGECALEGVVSIRMA